MDIYVSIIRYNGKVSVCHFQVLVFIKVSVTLTKFRIINIYS